MNKLSLLCLFAAGTFGLYAQAPTNAWKLSFGGTYPRFISGDTHPDNFNYGGFIGLGVL
jgi:hypothetical protein